MLGPRAKIRPLLSCSSHAGGDCESRRLSNDVYTIQISDAYRHEVPKCLRWKLARSNYSHSSASSSGRRPHRRGGGGGGGEEEEEEQEEEQEEDQEEEQEEEKEEGNYDAVPELRSLSG